MTVRHIVQENIGRNPSLNLTKFQVIFSQVFANIFWFVCLTVMMLYKNPRIWSLSNVLWVKKKRRLPANKRGCLHELGLLRGERTNLLTAYHTLVCWEWWGGNLRPSQTKSWEYRGLALALFSTLSPYIFALDREDRTLKINPVPICQPKNQKLPVPHKSK